MPVPGCCDDVTKSSPSGEKPPYRNPPVALVQEIWWRTSDTGTMTSTHVTELTAFTIDCSDATRLARFYAELTGGEVTGDYPEYGVAQTTTLG